MWLPTSPLVSLALSLFVPADAVPAALVPPVEVAHSLHDAGQHIMASTARDTGVATSAGGTPVAPAGNNATLQQPRAPSPQTPSGPSSATPRVPSHAASGEPPASDAALSTVVENVQKAYDATAGFSASFTQRYTYTLLRRTQESSGEVRFRKPGLMRWDYKNPEPKAFVVDGKSLWLHQPSDHNAFVNACFKQDGLTASVAFLWGQGRIKDQFHVSWFAGVFGSKTDHHLELVPKQNNSIFAKLILVVDPKTFRVKQSVVVDPSGNVNQFIFSNLSFQSPLSDDAFRFTPPPGTHVARMPGSCDAPIPGL